MSVSTEHTASEQIIMPELMGKGAWHGIMPIRVAQAHSANEPLSALFLDIDRFKEVNDLLGHDVGDRVIDDIKHVVSFVAHSLRTGENDDDPPSQRDQRNGASTTDSKPDMIAYSGPAIDTPGKRSTKVDPGHIGGDEFAVLAEVDEAGALAFATRLRKAFADYIDQPENAELKDLGIGLSIGVATLKPDMTGSELLRQADQAMYEDKLNRLEPLTEQQKAVLRLAKAAIVGSGLRMRDLLKYDSLLER